jgi:hypothetical protein
MVGLQPTVIRVTAFGGATEDEGIGGGFHGGVLGFTFEEALQEGLAGGDRGRSREGGEDLGKETAFHAAVTMGIGGSPANARIAG